MLFLFQDSQTVTQCEPTSPDKEITDNKVRFVCISDTHNRTDRLVVPPGDVLLHAGDFTMTGDMEEVQHFNSWLGG